MKREEVIAGGEYATDLGVHVRIEPEFDDEGKPVAPSAGWAVVGGEWGADEQFGTRLLKDGSTKQYQSNVALRATEVDTGLKVVVEPRRLMRTWDDHLKHLTAASEQRESLEANADALRLRAEKASVKARPDLRKQEVRVSFADFDALLRRAKV